MKSAKGEIAMHCEKFETYLPDLLLDPGRVPPDVQQHVRQCGRCEAEWKELQGTMQMLDGWQVPEPSPYFATRLSARMREERENGPTSWLERLRMRLLFGTSNLQLRPIMAGGFALLLIVTGGSYAGFVSLNRTVPPSQPISATVTDLELLDANAQTLQQLAAFDDSNFDTVAPASGSVYH